MRTKGSRNKNSFRKQVVELLDNKAKGMSNSQGPRAICDYLGLDNTSENRQKIRQIVGSIRRNDKKCWLNHGNGYYIPQSPEEAVFTFEYLSKQYQAIQETTQMLIAQSAELLGVTSNFAQLLLNTRKIKK